MFSSGCSAADGAACHFRFPFLSLTIHFIDNQVPVMNRSICLPLALALILLVLPRPTQGQFQNLVEHLPEDANTLVLFNMEAILASPLAVQEKWSTAEGNQYAAGLLIVPPQTKHLVMAAQMDLELMQPHWHASVMELSEEPSMLTVTERYGGNVDEIGGQDAAVLPNNTYVIKFGKFIAGTMSPADRQKATLWVQDVFALTGRKPLPAYLAEAENYASRTPILMAINLEHLLSPKYLRSRLDTMKSLQGQQIDLDQLATALASVRGATLGIEITDYVFGGLKVDFDADITLVKDVAKPLLLECLANHGAMIDEFNDWKVEVTAKGILLKGPLGGSGTQRIFSLLDTPPSLRPRQQPSSTTTASDTKPSESLIAQATLQYFKTIEILLNDLTGEDKQHQLTTPGLVAMWYAKYAAKIDALPVLHVDPELLSLATQVSGALRQSQNAMRSAGVRTASRMANMQGAQVYNYQYAAAAGERYGIYGGGYAYRYQYNPQASLRADGQQLAQIQEQETSKGYASANNLMQEITISMASMRKKLTEKYQIEF
jgi:hypothetical protein